MTSSAVNAPSRIVVLSVLKVDISLYPLLKRPTHHQYILDASRSQIDRYQCFNDMSANFHLWRDLHGSIRRQSIKSQRVAALTETDHPTRASDGLFRTPLLLKDQCAGCFKISA